MARSYLHQNIDGQIAFQGELGAYSHQAVQQIFGEQDVLPCDTFELALEAVSSKTAELAVIPIENSTAGRVADMHHLLPESGLYIIGEHFSPIHHALMAVPGATIEGLNKVTSHIQALHQCRGALRKIGVTSEPFLDTAGAARHIAELGDPTVGALASELAAEVYGLDILKTHMQDRAENTTRFVVLSRTPAPLEALSGPVMTSLTFEVRNIPASLYKAMGGFATNGVNMTKLESYYDSDSFTATEFYAEIVGHEGVAAVDRALEELRFHSKRVRILGAFEQEKPRGL